MPSEYLWEYSPLVRLGNSVWKRFIDPALRKFAGDEIVFMRRARGVIQIMLLAATILIPAAIFYSTAHLLTASGLLFDIAGALRLFLFDEIHASLSGFKENEYGNVPSVAMRELIMPEAQGPYDADAPYISQYYFKKRGVLFLILGFLLQLIGSVV
jgi:hypothetical protein